MADEPGEKPSSPERSVTTSPRPAQSPVELIAEGPQNSIEADDDLRDEDADSAIGSTRTSSTGSVAESIYAYRILHGRTYNSQSLTEYWAPIDEQQNEGLDLLHNCLLMAMNNKLFLAPIGDDPKRVLDVGTGTGIWAIDFGDMFPGAEVIGADLNDIQPSWVPPNVHFQIDDCLLDWTWPENHFDFIHIRALYGSIPNWEELYRKAFKHLKPGGWLQNLEPDVRVQSDYVHFPEDHIFNEWARMYYAVGDTMGRTFAISCGHTMRDTMEIAGFVNIKEVKIRVPCHGWPRNPEMRQAGLLLFAMLDQSMEGFGMYLFTTVMGWTPEEVLLFTARFREEIRRKSNCGWFAMTVVYGRKPEREPSP